MSKKPRQNYKSNAYVRVEQKYKDPQEVKKDKPWKKEHGTYDNVNMREVKKDKPWKKERGTFDNVNMSDLMAGFSNKGLAKKFSKHKYREYMG